MAITKITPRMQKALRDGKQLRFFADLWLSVLNDNVDSEAEFEASVAASNMDFTSVPNFARLATVASAYTIEQIAEDSSYDLWSSVMHDGVSTHLARVLFQSFLVSPGRKLQYITLNVDNSSGSDTTIKVLVMPGDVPTDAPVALGTYYSSYWSSVLYTILVRVPGSHSGDLRFSLADLALPDGTYTLVARAPNLIATNDCSIHYKNSNAYSYGKMGLLSTYLDNLAYTWNPDVGADLYFKLEFSGYEDSGYFTTKTLDMGEVPIDSGNFQMAYDYPLGTVLDVTLYGSATGAFAGEESTIPLALDGQTIAPFRYWRVRVDMESNSDRNASPLIDMVEILYPKDRIRLREKGVALNYIADDIQRDFQALMERPEFSLSDMKIIERVASGGQMALRLSEPSPDILQRVVSNYPLKTYRAAVYLGTDVPGFCTDDLLRFFIGSVDDAGIIPKYRKNNYGLELVLKNPILELKRKIPMNDQVGVLNFENIAISEDGVHVIDAMLDLMRGFARIPARYINLASFAAAKATIGSGVIVKRSNVFAPFTLGAIAAQTNTGNGTVSDLLLSLDAILGNYVLTCTAAAAGGGTFSVTDPAGASLGSATVGTPFSATGISFTIKVLLSGSVDFVVGDTSTIPAISPDTRIKSPTELTGLLKPLAEIADGYIIEDESSRISIVLHDPSASAEAVWADESMVRDGLVAAIPIEGADKAPMGYADLLFNLCYAGHSWDGSGSDWTAFGGVYSDIDTSSADDWGMGKQLYVSPMVNNMLEASKWLGPPVGDYQGDAIAEQIATRNVTRYAYPPGRMTGLVLPVSEFMRTNGSVIQLFSREYCEFKRKGIALSETIKFMIMSKKYDAGKNRMIFSVMRLK